jgi:hypothetical protein
MSANGRAFDLQSEREHTLGLRQVPRWAWLNGAAFALGMLPVVLALTVHDRGSMADPACVRQCYTLAHGELWILGFVGGPAVICLVLFVLLHLKSAYRSRLADRAAWSLTALSCLVAFLGLLISGLAMVPVAVLTVCAVAAAPAP